MNDVRLKDAENAPLTLGARDVADLQVISALCQDAAFPVSEMQWHKAARRFALLLSRLRWEDTQAQTNPERVRSLLLFDDVVRAASHGIDRNEAETVLSLLVIDFEPQTEGGGRIVLTFADEAALRLDVEAIGVTLKDVGHPYQGPYQTPSNIVPNHQD